MSVLLAVVLVVVLYFAYYGIKDRIKAYKNHKEKADFLNYKTSTPELAVISDDFFKPDMSCGKREKGGITYPCVYKNDFHCLYCRRRREVEYNGTHYYGYSRNCQFYQEENIQK